MRTIRLGQIALSFHRASTAYITHILNRRGYEVSLVEAPHEEAFELLKNNEIDMLISAWLPGSHGEYFEPFQQQIIKMGTIYDPYCIWGVPDYINWETISRVEDLKNPEVATLFEKQIFCINPGAGISRFSLEIICKYRLQEHGYTLTNIPENEYFAYIERSIAQKKYVIIPFWHPQFLHYKYKLRELDEPFGLLRGKDEATLLLRKDSVPKLDSETLITLKNIHLGNLKISSLDYLLHIDKKNITEALNNI